MGRCTPIILYGLFVLIGVKPIQPTSINSWLLIKFSSCTTSEENLIYCGDELSGLFINMIVDDSYKLQFEVPNI